MGFFSTKSVKNRNTKPGKAQDRTADKSILTPKWHNTEIPAQIFFDILYSWDFSLMGGSEELRESYFMKIFDEYAELEGSDKITEAYRKRCRIMVLSNWISAINSMLYLITYAPLTRDERLSVIDALNSIEEKPEDEFGSARMLVKFSKDKPITEEVSRIQTRVLGRLRNELNIETATEKKQTEAIKYNFMQEIVTIEGAIGRNIEDGVTLGKFVFLKKQAIDKANALKKQHNGR